jgi:hypothetical protein
VINVGRCLYNISSEQATVSGSEFIDHRASIDKPVRYISYTYSFLPCDIKVKI